MQQIVEVGPRARTDLAEELLDQELVLYDERSGGFHWLNGGAAMIWLLCDGTRAPADIARELSDQANVPLAQAEADVADALARFQTLGLLARDEAVEIDRGR